MLSMLDINNQTKYVFSEDLSISYKEDIPDDIPITKWEVLAEREEEQITNIDRMRLQNGLDVLKISIDQTVNSCSGKHTINKYILLYELEISERIGRLCLIPTHNLDLPEEYQNFRYIYREWTEDQEENGETSEYTFIQTKIDDITKSAFPYSIAALETIPIVSKDTFFELAHNRK